MKKLKLEVIGDRILVQRASLQEKTTDCGLVLPVSAQDKDYTAKVVAVSETVNTFNVGDTVLISSTAGVNFAYDSEKYLVLRINEVLVRVCK